MIGLTIGYINLYQLHFALSIHYHNDLHLYLIADVFVVWTWNFNIISTPITLYYFNKPINIVKYPKLDMYCVFAGTDIGNRGFYTIYHQSTMGR